MATTVRMQLPGLPADPQAHRKATLRSVDGRLAMTVPISDAETAYSSLGQEWATITRSPLPAVSYRRGPKLARMTFSGQMIATNRDMAITGEVMALKALCDSLSAVVLSYGTLEAKMTRSGAWVIEDGSVKVSQRVQGSNDPRWCTFELQLLEYATFEGRKFTVPAPILAQSSRSTAAGDRVPATYKWRSGDDLVSLALRLYGDAGMWTKIGDLNRIRDPRAIAVGTILRLP